MKTTNTTNLSNHFLVAMPCLNGSLFGHSITYICEHGPEGAMGIVINHPTKLTADDVFKQLNMGNLSTAHKDPILAGGPVQTERGFVLHSNGSKRWKTTQAISSDICLTTSQDILDDMAHDQGPEHSLIALGYAGWEAGQLEEEIAENAWLTLPAETDILFKTPIEHRASLAAAKLGIDLALIAPDAGHA